jgi:predicted dehydrogenase
MLRIGVIGCGDIAGKNYLPGMHQPDRGIALQAACDIVSERAEQAARGFGAEQHFGDYHQMLAEADINQVVILTPLFTHAEIVRDCLEAGKHVYTEKPLARTREEAEQLLDLAESKQLLLTAAPLLMVYREFQHLRSLIQQGALGKVCFVRAHSSHGGPERGEWATDSGNYYREEFVGKVPPIYDMAVYALTILTAVLGPVRRVAAMSGTAIAERRIEKVTLPGFQPYTMRPAVHDNAMILLEWEEACLGAVDASFCMRHNKAPQYEFYGSDGSLYMGRAGMNIISTVEGFAEPEGWHEVEMPPGGPGRKEGWGEALGRHLHECVEQGRRPAFGGRQAVHVVELMEKILASAQSGEMLTVASTF